jgi:FkbM family methyltransferase
VSDHDPTYWERIAALLRGMAREAPALVDVGGNHGDFSARFLETFPAGRTDIVEPNPALHAELRARFAGRPATLWEAALHDRDGTVDLRVHANDGTSSVLERPRSSRRYFSRQDQVTATVGVAALTLDTLAQRAGLARIDLLKLDTQGAELPILRGARGLLARGAIDLIYTEFFVVPHYEGAALLHEIWAQLDAHDYVLHDIFKGPYGRNGQLRFGDALFVSPRVREDHLDRFPEEP